MNNFIGTQIDQYMVTQYIAGGGMAEVYLAQDTTLQRPVALKIMRRELAEDETFIARFNREALSVARLHHPNIVQIYTAGTTADKRPYLAMQYVSGGTLKDILQKLHKRNQRLPVRDTLRLIRQIADALDTAHQAGIVHRDIKPSNILMHPDGTPILTDLGIAAVSSATQLTRTDVTMGTPHYMSPEQAQGSKIDHRADLYALGIILYELLSGAVPFTGDSPIAVLNQHVNEPPQPLALVQPGLNDATYHVVEMALQKNVARRFRSAREMMAAIDDALAAEAVVMPTPRTEQPPTVAAPPAVDTAVHLPPQQTIPPDPYDPTYNQLPTAENSLSPQNRRWGLIGGGIVLA
ncbi:MAG: protein kinase, partial [Chloroflexi bacterium]|nr:protein kinase [Chloroflexota bacterium]